jgi:hypothetical protein
VQRSSQEEKPPLLAAKYQHLFKLIF